MFNFVNCHTIRHAAQLNCTMSTIFSDEFLVLVLRQDLNIIRHISSDVQNGANLPDIKIQMISMRRIRFVNAAARS